MSEGNPSDIFDSADWYDLGIDWESRLNREVPVLCDIFGPPGEAGLLDAGCGPGRQLAAMVQAGYRVAGLDRSTDMLRLARRHVRRLGVEANLIEGSFDGIGRGSALYDGIYCLGNSLAATGTAAIAAQSLAALASVLLPGGRLVLQLLNFEKLRQERPAVRGPRVRRDGDREYVSTRVYAFYNETVEVTNVTVWYDQGWRQHAHVGLLCAICRGQLEQWCSGGQLRIEALYGSYAREPFDPERSNDLIVVATRQG